MLLPGYWTRKSITRRTALRGAAVAGAGAAALSLIGCGGGDDNKASGGSANSGALDPTKGKPGGSFVIQANVFPTNMDIVQVSSGNSRIAGLTNSGLLAYAGGRTGVDAWSLDQEPDAAQSLPEQPDQLTQVYKLMPGIKFHNGRAMTSEDVKYSLERYRSFDKSVWRGAYTFIDRVDTPDPQTVIVKNKTPFADAVQTMAAYQHPYLLAKEHEEGPDVNQKLMGSGPYTFASLEPPAVVRLKKNPDYFRKPYPYFDDVTFVHVTDAARQVTDFTTRQLHYSWFATYDIAVEIKPQRPDAVEFAYPAFGQAIFPRTDQAPFNDKRVRQAMSMALNRKVMREGVFGGEGEDDQTLSISNRFWGFRKPKDLKSAKYWEFNVAEARKLLTAAGVERPVEGKLFQYPTGAASQFLQNLAVLIQSNWKEAGLGTTKDTGQPNPIFLSRTNIGDFDDIGFFQNSQYVTVGNFWRERLTTPPEGVRPPTQNSGRINNPDLNRLAEKQAVTLSFEERKATFREIEEILGEEQYRMILSTYNQSWFVDPSVQNVSVFQYSTSGGANYVKYYWFA